jgi:hypothetical protein
MPFNPIGGPSGSVLVGGVAYAFGKWRFSMKTGLPRVNNFTSAYQLLVAGLTSGTLTLDGPYDGGNMPLTSGTSYAFTLRFSGAISLLVTALVGEIGPSQDIEDAARVTVTAESNGSFTAAIT